MPAPTFLRPAAFAALLALAGGLSAPAHTASAQPQREPPEPEQNERQLLPIPGRGALPALRGAVLPASTMAAHEVEPNDAPASATPIASSSARLRGDIFPNGDVDWYAFIANAGDRVYAATMTSFSASGSTDSVLTLFAPDGSTVLEEDDNDGTFGGNASTIAGTVLLEGGIHYLRVRHFNATTQLRPYDLYLQVRSGSPAAEVEPNSPAPQPMPESGWASGAITPAADTDLYSFDLAAGDAVFLSLDTDPERDGIAWNGRIGLGPINGLVLAGNDGSVTSPNSEALFLTVKDAGTYFAYVDEAAAGGAGTFSYHLSVTRFPAVPATPVCTTYSSTDTPLAIPDGPGLVTSSITVPGNPRVADLDLVLNLTHANMPDLDLTLVAPAGNEVALFTDIGSSTQTQMNLRLDDEAALPITSFSVVSGVAVQGEAQTARLSWLDGQDAGGTWTLRVNDDLAANGGSLQSWSLVVCEVEPPPSCPAGTTPFTAFETDFEADDGGFVSAGVAVDWAWGTPTAAPIDACASGTGCWKTNLAGTYSVSSSQTITSPSISLASLVPPISLEWAQKYQMESATFDTAHVQVQNPGGANPIRPWVWRDATMTQGIGNPVVTLQQSAGWGRHRADLSAYAGQDIEAVFSLTSDITVQLAGLAIDDVRVSGCLPVPEISLEATVSTTTGSCGVADHAVVAPGTALTQCYTALNTGGVTLTQHSVTDTLGGALISNVAYDLLPGESAYATRDDVPAFMPLTNASEWTASNPAPPAFASDTDRSEIRVTGPGQHASICSAPGLEIPTAGTVSDTLKILGDVLIGDLDVRIDADHSWVGDVTITLTHLESGTSAVLVDRPGHPASTFGCGNDNIEAVVDDEGTDPPLESQCSATPPALSGRAIGGDPASASLLSAFDGLAAGGTWRLEVDDNATPDGGLLNSWCLDITAAEPNIDVSVASVSSTQAPDTASTASVGLSNTGAVALDWSIAEEPRAPVRAQPGPVALPAGVADAAGAEPAGATVGGTTQGKGSPRRSMRIPGVTLYDNGPLVTHPGGGANGADASTVQTALGLVNLGFGNQWLLGNRVADDFTVPSPGWFIGAVTVYAYQTGSGLDPTLLGASLRLWDGPPGDPGSSVVFGDESSNRLLEAGWSGIYRTTDTDLGSAVRPIMALTLAVNTALPPGTYWLDWSASGTTPLTGPWAPPISILGSATTGDARQALAGIWQPLLDSGNPQGLPFIIHGSDGCVAAADVPWLSTSVVGGSLAPGGSETIDVQFDSAGLATGTYRANLCVASNDPDPGTGNGTAMVAIPVQLDVVGTPAISTQLTVAPSPVPFDPGFCPTDTAITVAPGTPVTLCYQVSNTGDVALTRHTLVDSQIGNVLLDFFYTLDPGANAFIVQETVADVTRTHVSTWTANNPGPVDVASDMASATVTVQSLPSISLTATVGTTPGACAASTALLIDPGTEVTYCYTVTNTGNIAFSLHDLEDDRLGQLLSGAAQALAPGESYSWLHAAVPAQSQTHVATWTAYNAGMADLSTAQATVQVSVGEPIFRDGFESP